MTATAAAPAMEKPNLDISPVFGAPTRCPNCKDEEDCATCGGSRVAHMTIKGPGSTLY